jgi:hypothetical protein
MSFFRRPPVVVFLNGAKKFRSLRKDRVGESLRHSDGRELNVFTRRLGKQLVELNVET